MTAMKILRSIVRLGVLAGIFYVAMAVWPAVGAILALVGLLCLNEKWEQDHAKRNRDNLEGRP